MARTNWKYNEIVTETDLNELGQQVNENTDALAVHEAENATDAHKISNITGLQTALDGKETPAGAQAKADIVMDSLNEHKNFNDVHGATYDAVGDRIIRRDSNGRAKVAEPVAGNDIARKDTVDNAVNELAGNGRTNETVKGTADSLASHKADYTTLKGQVAKFKISNIKNNADGEPNGTVLFYTGE